MVNLIVTIVRHESLAIIKPLRVGSSGPQILLGKVHINLLNLVDSSSNHVSLAVKFFITILYIFFLINILIYDYLKATVRLIL